MIDLTEQLIPHAASMDRYFNYGVEDSSLRRRPAGGDLYLGRRLFAGVRQRYGLAHRPASLLTSPSGNLKLSRATTPSYGLTLQHYVQKLTTGPVINACPNAGDCTKVCVLDNGHGRDPRVQRARRAKTEFLVEYPAPFAYMLGHELAKARMRHGQQILFRPNVNSDVAWEQLLPSMTSGAMLDVMLYGYTKRLEVFKTDGWLDAAYRVAYSWNENSPRSDRVLAFIQSGGSVAVVTDRKKRGALAPITLGAFTYGLHRIVDADLTDEWIFENGVVGDLSAKGKARSLIGKSGFVVSRGVTP